MPLKVFQTIVYSRYKTALKIKITVIIHEVEIVSGYAQCSEFRRDTTKGVPLYIVLYV